ncbi:MAG: peptidyl-prolyl cis-trans isomerase, partial [Gemmatimonadales bacterium]|nr:peptidyl-prolyl cis-trans isomerase [Gemmatimonadales bacterium]
MRRGPLLVLAVLSLAGCSNVRDLFSAHANTAAEGGGQELTPERLAAIMTGAKGMKPSKDAGRFVANVWVDYALFAQAAANGKLPTDSASIAEAVWPEIAELRGIHWHDSLMARRGKLGPNAGDSVYKLDTVRVLQHILFRVPQGATPDIRGAARKKAETTLAKVKKGDDFGRLATALSDDPGSKMDQGFLPPSPKGAFVTAFDSAGWSLAPGAVSGVVETPFGYHIIKRPIPEAVRERLTGWVAQRAGTRLDSVYMDSLAMTSKLRIAKGAPKAMRAAAKDPESARGSKTELVSYRDGELTVSDFLRWMRALPPQYVAQLREADDSNLTQFARVLTQNVLLLRQADSAKVRVTQAEWAEMRGRYESQLDTLRMEMGITDEALGGKSAAQGERNKVAALKLDTYFARLVGGKQRIRPLPSALATVLRERGKYDIHESGVNRAVEIAMAKMPKTDSSLQMGPMQRAPGGPPIPGGAPA